MAATGSLATLIPGLLLAAALPMSGLAAPQGDLAMSGLVVVSAEASDDVGVAGVQFLLNGAPLGQEDGSDPYSTVWDTTAVPDGVYQLTARARDVSGNVSISEPVSVVIDNGPEPDTAPPTIAMIRPADGATVSGMVEIAASASDDVGVVGVEFFLDGSPIGAEVLSGPWLISWDTKGAENGTHALVARARDAAGNTATSRKLAVVVDNTKPDTSPPKVQATSPLEGSTVSGTIELSAEASDDVGVAGVQFLVDGSPVGEDLAAPFAMRWDTTSVADGGRMIQARAWDAGGNEATSRAVTVEVANSPAADPSSTDPAPDARSEQDPAPLEGGMLEVVLVSDDDAGTVLIRARSEGAGVVEYSLIRDSEVMAKSDGGVFEYLWDTNGMIGAHDLHIVGTDAGGQTVVGADLYQLTAETGSTSGRGRRRGWSSSGPTTSSPLVLTAEPDAKDPGLLDILGGSSFGDVRELELYIDRELVGSSRRGRPVDLEWRPVPGTGPHELMMVGYDRSGIRVAGRLVIP